MGKIIRLSDGKESGKAIDFKGKKIIEIIKDVGSKVLTLEKPFDGTFPISWNFSLTRGYMPGTSAATADIPMFAGMTFRGAPNALRTDTRWGRTFRNFWCNNATSPLSDTWGQMFSLDVVKAAKIGFGISGQEANPRYPLTYVEFVPDTTSGGYKATVTSTSPSGNVTVYARNAKLTPNADLHLFTTDGSGKWVAVYARIDSNNVLRFRFRGANNYEQLWLCGPMEIYTFK